MPTNRDKLLKGVRFITFGFPFIFLGPIVLTMAGIPNYREGSYGWLALSILFMAIAGFLCVKGLRTILAAFFDNN